MEPEPTMATPETLAKLAAAEVELKALHAEIKTDYRAHFDAACRVRRGEIVDSETHHIAMRHEAFRRQGKAFTELRIQATDEHMAAFIQANFRPPPFTGPSWERAWVTGPGAESDA